VTTVSALMKTSVALVALVALAGCVAPEEEFYAKLFLCNFDNKEPQCGTDRRGKPMVCYPGHFLGGSDFCAEACDPAQAEGDKDFVCIDDMGANKTGARIQTCQLSPGAKPCPSGLSCYRTNVLGDDGLCVSTRVCSDESDCRDIGQTCSSKYSEAIGGSSLGLKSDSLHCVQETCSTSGSKCRHDQACLFDDYASGDVLPDICVPKCSQDGQCPPNFSCARTPQAPGSPDSCVPGVAGVKCTKSQDCLVGDCLDTGAGFSVCTLPMSCATNDYCAILDQPVDKFICVEGIPGQAICVNSRPYGGGNCKNADECPAGQECMFYSALAPEQPHGSCRTPCPEGHCEARGGMPYVCVEAAHRGGCHPTDFGLPCSSDDDCFKGLTCVAAGFDERSLHNYSPSICTTSCATDADCDANRLTGKGGFCELESGICRRRGHTGLPCSRDAHCYSGRCGTEGKCLG
jgi:hypothetical protein